MPSVPRGLALSRYSVLRGVAKAWGSDIVWSRGYSWATQCILWDQSGRGSLMGVGGKLRGKHSYLRR